MTNKLRELAQAAGNDKNCNWFPSDTLFRVLTTNDRFTIGTTSKAEWQADSEYIAAANPQAILSLLGRLEWQPISTAPKDGRKLILLLTPSGFPQVAYSNTWWTAGFSVENKPTHWMPLPQAPQEQDDD